MLYFSLCLPVFALMAFLLRACRFDAASGAIILAALTLCYVQFYMTSWQEFTLDAPMQGEYVRHIALTGSLPDPVKVPAGRHPPAYYILAAGLYRFAALEPATHPLDMARHVSMLCYALFMFCAARLLRAWLPPASPAYYTALAMLLFWPIGVTMGGRITCDLLLYAAMAGTLLYLSFWIKDKSVIALSNAFICAGIAALAKNIGIALFMMSAGALLLATYEHRKNLRLLVTWRLAMSILFSAGCCASSRYHGWVTHYFIETASDHWKTLWDVLTSFNPVLLLFDTDMGLSHDRFWNMFLHSLLLGNVMPWKAKSVLVAYNCIWSSLLFYMAMGALRFRPKAREQKMLYLLLASFTGIMVAAAIYMRVRTGNTEYSDARYAYPVVIAVTLAYGKLLHMHHMCGNTGYYRIGVGLGLAFVPLTLALYILQYLQISI